jgi:hypothetical protein
MEISYLVVSAHPPHRHAAPVRRRHFATLHRLLLEQVRQAADGLVWSEERHRYLLGPTRPALEPARRVLAMPTGSRNWFLFRLDAHNVV